MLVLFLFVAVMSDAQGPVSKTFPSGSYVIAMDNDNQSLVSMKPFNLRAYGLVNELLQNNIPVSWVIDSGKVKDGIDFSANANRVYPSTAAAANYDFRAGPFLIDSAFASKADLIIQGFGDSVAVYRLNHNVTAIENVYLVEKPRVAILNSGGVTNTPASMLDSAGFDTTTFPSWKVVNPSDLLAGEYTLAVDYHNSTAVDTSITLIVDSFLTSGGDFFAGSNSIEYYEDVRHWATTSGITGSFDVGTSISYPNPAHPICQFHTAHNPWIGPLNAFTADAAFKPGVVFINEKTATIKMTLCVDLASSSPGGIVTYHGGTNPNASTNIGFMNGVRVFLNSIFQPTGRAIPNGLNFATEEKPQIWIVNPQSAYYVGDTITYATSVVNSGPGVGNNLLISDTIPHQLSLLVSSSTAGSHDSLTGQWWVPGQQLNQEDTLWISAIINDTGNIPLTAWLEGPIPGNLTNNDTVSVSFTAKPPCAATTMNDTAICGDSIAITAIQPANGIGAWKMVTAGGVIDNQFSINTFVDSLVPGINKILWVVSDGFCTAEDTLKIESHQLIVADPGFDVTVCGDSVNLSGNDPSPGSGQWSTTIGNATIDFDTAFSTKVRGFDQGANQFEWKITNGLCVDSATVNITAPLPFAITAGPDTSICDTFLRLSGTDPGTGTGVWEFANGTGSFDNDVIPITMTHFDGAGVYAVRWVVESGICADTGTVTVEVNAISTEAGVDTSICVSDYQLNAIPGPNGQWTIPAGSGTLDDSSDASTIIRSPSTGNITLYWSIDNGTCTATDSVTLNVQSAPGSVSAGGDLTVYLPTQTLTGSNPGNGTGRWTTTGNATIVSPLLEQTSVENLQLGPNEFIWTIDAGDCGTFADTVILTLLELRIPQGISPNGDGANDNWVLPTLNQVNYNVRIFDRWGQEVYVSDDYDNNWTGKNNSGNDLPDDTYYYRLRLSNGTDVDGYVVLRR